MPDIKLTDPTANLHAAGTQAHEFEREVRIVTHEGGRKQAVHSTLTRRGMEAVIRSGQSVLVNGLPVSSIDALPTEDQLAVQSGSREAVDNRVREKELELAKMRAELEALKTASAKAAIPVPAPSVKEPMPEPLPAEAKPVAKAKS